MGGKGACIAVHENHKIATEKTPYEGCLDFVKQTTIALGRMPPMKRAANTN